MSQDAAKAQLFYSQLPEGAKPYQWIDPPKDPNKPIKNFTQKEFEYTIHDIRNSDEKLDTESSGFEFVPQFSTSLQYDDYVNDDIVKDRYYKDISRFLKEHFKAYRVDIFDHTIRRSPPTGTTVPDTPQTRQPVSRVHVDQTPTSALRRVSTAAGNDADKLLQKRARLVNAWKPLKGPVLDSPLAVADFRSMNLPTDLSPSDLRYESGYVGETYLVAHNPSHRWYYASEMQPNELLLLKCWDNKNLVGPDQDNKKSPAGLTPHTGFADSRYYNKQAVEPRESIEVRAIVFSEE